MQKVLILILLLSTSAAAKVSPYMARAPWYATMAESVTGYWDGTAYRTPACGLNDVFTSAYCGAVNSLAAPGGATNIAACDTTPGTPERITAAGTYTVDAGIGTSNQKCLTVNGNFSAKLTIYLEGAFNGRLYISGNMNGGLEVYGASGAAITCAWTGSGGDTGCLLFSNSGGAMTAGYSIHDLTISNTVDPGANGAVGVMGTMQNASWSGSGNILELYNLTTTTATGTTSNRISNITVNGINAGGQTAPSLAYNLKGTCAADANACQGIVFFCMKDAVIRNSYFNMTQSTTSETSRGAVIDGDGGTACSSGGVIKDNLIEANNNRAIRLRSTTNAKIENNTIKNIRNANGAIHTGDTTGDVDWANGNLQIINNRLEVRDGVGIWGRGLTGNALWARNNTATCHSSGCGTGRFASASVPIGTQTDTIFNLQNNTVAAGIGAGGICTSGTATNSCAATSTHVAHCGGGTVSGAGTITTPGCP